MIFKKNKIARVRALQEEAVIKYRESEAFKSDALAFAFLNQSKPPGEIFAKMEFAFIDSNGKNYYRYRENDDTPVDRMEVQQIILRELKNRISYEDLDNTFSSILTIANEEKRRNKITDITYIIYSLQKRRELLYEPNLLLKMCACLYIREDQDPTIWDVDLENEKIEQFKKDRPTGLYDFFYKSGLSEFLPGFPQSADESTKTEILNNQQSQVEEFKKLVHTLPK